MNFDELKDAGFQEKLKGASSPEEILAIAREEGYELSDDELKDVSGGSWGSSDTEPTCPYCGSHNVRCYNSNSNRMSPALESGDDWECLDCEATWTR